MSSYTRIAVFGDFRCPERFDARFLCGCDSCISSKPAGTTNTLQSYTEQMQGTKLGKCITKPDLYPLVPAAFMIHSALYLVEAVAIGAGRGALNLSIITESLQNITSLRK